MSKIKLIIATSIIIAIVIGVGIDWSKPDSRTRTLWQQAVMPGALSQPHAFLSNDCAACHVPVKGIQPAQCVACHANNKALLQRQPTAFHAQIKTCSGCHLEHQGSKRMPTTMDHALLAKLAHRELPTAQLSASDIEAAASLSAPIPRSMSPSLAKTHKGGELMLNCASCHATKDRHQGLFGSNCVQCHVSNQWSIAEFRHPSPRSTECSQCHKPPPSHNMGHFKMMSARLARQPNAKVNQCYACHQTTTWNDIKGTGWIKHH